jgi:hypothetical protein
MMTSTDFRDRIAAIVERAKESVPSTEQVVMVSQDIRALPGVDVVDLVNVRVDEYEVRLSLLEHLERVVAALKRVAPLELAAAPVVVDLLPISETQFNGALIMRYAACPGERFTRADKIEGPFRPEAAERFRADMHKLAEHGMVHPYVRGLMHWLVSSETGTIVLDEWSVVEEADDDDIEKMRRTVDRLLASKSK